MPSARSSAARSAAAASPAGRVVLGALDRDLEGAGAAGHARRGSAPAGRRRSAAARPRRARPGGPRCRRRRGRPARRAASARPPGRPPARSPGSAAATAAATVRSSALISVERAERVAPVEVGRARVGLLGREPVEVLGHGRTGRPAGRQEGRGVVPPGRPSGALATGPGARRRAASRWTGTTRAMEQRGVFQRRASGTPARARRHPARRVLRSGRARRRAALVASPCLGDRRGRRTTPRPLHAGVTSGRNRARLPGGCASTA